MSFQDPATINMEGIIDFHHDLSYVIIILAVFVIYMMFVCIQNANVKKNVNFSAPMVHNSTLEIIWTIIPAVILMLIATPSFALLYSMDEIVAPVITLKAIGHQWYWHYENTNKFVSNQIYKEEMRIMQSKREPRLLSTDRRIQLPIRTSIRLVVTSADVLHSWTIPSLGIKIDACPGRLNQASFFLKREGLFYGQCSEICGTGHGFMPIALRSNEVYSFQNKLFFKETNNKSNLISFQNSSISKEINNDFNLGKQKLNINYIWWVPELYFFKVYKNWLNVSYDFLVRYQEMFKIYQYLFENNNAYLNKKSYIFAFGKNYSAFSTPVSSSNLINKRLHSPFNSYWNVLHFNKLFLKTGSSYSSNLAYNKYYSYIYEYFTSYLLNPNFMFFGSPSFGLFNKIDYFNTNDYLNFIKNPILLQIISVHNYERERYYNNAINLLNVIKHFSSTNNIAKKNDLNVSSNYGDDIFFKNSDRSVTVDAFVDSSKQLIYYNSFLKNYFLNLESTLTVEGRASLSKLILENLKRFEDTLNLFLLEFYGIKKEKIKNLFTTSLFYYNNSEINLDYQDILAYGLGVKNLNVRYISFDWFQLLYTFIRKVDFYLLKTDVILNNLSQFGAALTSSFNAYPFIFDYNSNNSMEDPNFVMAANSEAYFNYNDELPKSFIKDKDIKDKYIFNFFSKTKSKYIFGKALDYKLDNLLFKDDKNILPSFNGWFRFHSEIADLPQYSLYRRHVSMVLKHKYGLLSWWPQEPWFNVSDLGFLDTDYINSSFFEIDEITHDKFYASNLQAKQTRKTFIFVAKHLNRILENGIGNWLDELVEKNEVSFEYVWMLLNHAREHDLDPRWIIWVILRGDYANYDYSILADVVGKYSDKDIYYNKVLQHNILLANRNKLEVNTLDFINDLFSGRREFDANLYLSSLTNIFFQSESSIALLAKNNEFVLWNTVVNFFKSWFYFDGSFFTSLYQSYNLFFSKFNLKTADIYQKTYCRLAWAEFLADGSDYKEGVGRSDFFILDDLYLAPGSIYGLEFKKNNFIDVVDFLGFVKNEHLLSNWLSEITEDLTQMEDDVLPLDDLYYKDLGDNDLKIDYFGSLYDFWSLQDQIFDEKIIDLENKNKNSYFYNFNIFRKFYKNKTQLVNWVKLFKERTLLDVDINNFYNNDIFKLKFETDAYVEPIKFNDPSSRNYDHDGEASILQLVNDEEYELDDMKLSTLNEISTFEESYDVFSIFIEDLILFFEDVIVDFLSEGDFDFEFENFLVLSERWNYYKVLNFEINKNILFDLKNFYKNFVYVNFFEMDLPAIESSNFSFFQFVDTLELDEAMNNPKDYDDADAELDGDYRMAEIVDNIGLSTPYEIEGYVYETSYNAAQNIEVFPEDSFYNDDKLSDCSSDDEDFDYLEPFSTFDFEVENFLMETVFGEPERTTFQELQLGRAGLVVSDWGSLSSFSRSRNSSFFGNDEEPLFQMYFYGDDNEQLPIDHNMAVNGWNFGLWGASNNFFRKENELDAMLVDTMVYYDNNEWFADWEMKFYKNKKIFNKAIANQWISNETYSNTVVSNRWGSNILYMLPLQKELYLDEIFPFADANWDFWFNIQNVDLEYDFQNNLIDSSFNFSESKKNQVIEFKEWNSNVHSTKTSKQQFNMNRFLDNFLYKGTSYLKKNIEIKISLDDDNSDFWLYITNLDSEYDFFGYNYLFNFLDKDKYIYSIIQTYRKPNQTEDMIEKVVSLLQTNNLKKNLLYLNVLRDNEIKTSSKSQNLFNIKSLYYNNEKSFFLNTTPFYWKTINKLSLYNSNLKFLTNKQDFLNEDVVSYTQGSLDKYVGQVLNNEGFECLPLDAINKDFTLIEIYNLLGMVNSEIGIYDNYINYYENVFKLNFNYFDVSKIFSIWLSNLVNFNLRVNGGISSYTLPVVDEAIFNEFIEWYSSVDIFENQDYNNDIFNINSLNVAIAINGEITSWFEDVDKEFYDPSIKQFYKFSLCKQIDKNYKKIYNLSSDSNIMNQENFKFFYKDFFSSISKFENNKYFFYNLIKPNNFDLILDGINLKNLEVKYDFIEEKKINNFFFNNTDWQISLYSKFFNSSYSEAFFFPEVTKEKKELSFEYTLLYDADVDNFLEDEGNNGWLHNDAFDNFFEDLEDEGDGADLWLIYQNLSNSYSLTSTSINSSWINRFISFFISQDNTKTIRTLNKDQMAMNLKQKYFCNLFKNVLMVPVNERYYRYWSEYSQIKIFSNYVAELEYYEKYDEIEALYNIYNRYRSYTFYWFYVKSMIDENFAKEVNSKYRWLVANYDVTLPEEVGKPEHSFVESNFNIEEFSFWYQTFLGKKEKRSEFLLDFQKAFGSEVTTYIAERLDKMDLFFDLSSNTNLTKSKVFNNKDINNKIYTDDASIFFKSLKNSSTIFIDNPQDRAAEFCKKYEVFNYLLLRQISRYAQANSKFRTWLNDYIENRRLKLEVNSLIKRMQKNMLNYFVDLTEIPSEKIANDVMLGTFFNSSINFKNMFSNLLENPLTKKNYENQYFFYNPLINKFPEENLFVYSLIKKFSCLFPNMYTQKLSKSFKYYDIEFVEGINVDNDNTLPYFLKLDKIKFKKEGEATSVSQYTRFDVKNNQNLWYNSFFKFWDTPVYLKKFVPNLDKFKMSFNLQNGDVKDFSWINSEVKSADMIEKEKKKKFFVWQKKKLNNENEYLKSKANTEFADSFKLHWFKTFISYTRLSLYSYSFKELYEFNYSTILNAIYQKTNLNSRFLQTSLNLEKNFFDKIFLLSIPKNSFLLSQKNFFFNNNFKSTYFNNKPKHEFFLFSCGVGVNYFLKENFFEYSKKILAISILNTLQQNNDFTLLTFLGSNFKPLEKDVLLCFPTLYLNKLEGFFIHYSSLVYTDKFYKLHWSSLGVSDYYSFVIGELTNRFNFGFFV